MDYTREFAGFLHGALAVTFCFALSRMRQHPGIQGNRGGDWRAFKDCTFITLIRGETYLNLNNGTLKKIVYLTLHFFLIVKNDTCMFI